METKVLEIFDECVNGKESCALCPYHGKEPYCRNALGKDLMTYIETLKDQIEYYEEVIEEYEKAEHDREDIYKTITLMSPPGIAYGETGWTTTDKWIMGFDEASSDGVYTTTTASSGCCDESWTTTTSGSYAHAEGIATTASGGYACAEGLATTTSASSIDAKEYVLDSHDRVIAELEKPSPRKKWYKRE